MAQCQEIEVYKPPPDLEERLKEEQDILERYFWPEKYPILHKDGMPCFEHKVKIKEGRIYNLRVYASSEYPEEYPYTLPDLVVCESPEPMPDGLDWNGSHDTHTYPRIYGFLHICHWHWAAWTKENMIYQVFNKGEEWLEAYEKYLVTKKIKLDLKQMELTEEEKQKVAVQRQLQLQQTQQFLQQLAHSQRGPDYPTHPNALNQLWIDIWCTFGVTSDILSQNNLPNLVPEITVDEGRFMQRLISGDIFTLQRVNEGPDGIMIPQLIRFRCALNEHKAVWPDWLTVLLKFLATILMMELEVYWRNMHIGPRSLPNN